MTCTMQQTSDNLFGDIAGPWQHAGGARDGRVNTCRLGEGMLLKVRVLPSTLSLAWDGSELAVCSTTITVSEQLDGWSGVNLALYSVYY